jgi:hypothetical protein
MHHAKAVSPLVTALTVVAFAAEALAAASDDDNDTTQRHRAGDILVQRVLVQMDGLRADGSKGWLASHMAIRKGTGIVYRYNMTTEDQQKVILSVGGPVLKRGTFGMLFEVRF